MYSSLVIDVQIARRRRSVYEDSQGGEDSNENDKYRPFVKEMIIVHPETMCFSYFIFKPPIWSGIQEEDKKEYEELLDNKGNPMEAIGMSTRTNPREYCFMKPILESLIQSCLSLYTTTQFKADFLKELTRRTVISLFDEIRAPARLSLGIVGSEMPLPIHIALTLANWLVTQRGICENLIVTRSRVAYSPLKYPSLGSSTNFLSSPSSTAVSRKSRDQDRQAGFDTVDSL